jgi:hypothetical protein
MPLMTASFNWPTLAATRLVVDTTGNIGIGTATPANKLTLFKAGYGFEHTDGNVRLGTYISGISDDGWMGTISSHKLNFFVNGGTASMTIDTGGRVGIGTTTPTARLEVNASGSPVGVYGIHAGSGNGVFGQSAGGPGVFGSGTAPTGIGVAGTHSAATGTQPGVKGTTYSTEDAAVGVLGEVISATPGIASAAVRGDNHGTGSVGVGVTGTHAGSGWGVYGQSVDGHGVHGDSGGLNGIGVYGSGADIGVGGAGYYGVYGTTLGDGHGYAIYGNANGGSYAGFFQGDVTVTGELNVLGSKNFKIDHPLDPANKYLLHASIESSEVLNLYTGNITTDSSGDATVPLPDCSRRLTATSAINLLSSASSRRPSCRAR